MKIPLVLHHQILRFTYNKAEVLASRQTHYNGGITVRYQDTITILYVHS